MPSKIGEAILVIKANAKGLKTGLDKCPENQFPAALGKGMEANVSRALPGTAYPIVGGELKGLGWQLPAGLPSAAIGTACCCRSDRDGQEDPGLGALTRHRQGNPGRLC